MENFLSDDGGLPAKNGTGFSRRKVLLGLASTLLATSLLSYPFLSQAEQHTAATNPLQFARFFKISQTLTEHNDIDQGMSARIFTALHNHDAQFTSKVEQISHLLQPGQSAKQLQQQATQAGLQDVLTAIITAWYTGTVGHGQTAELIAYKDALMYRPASDALIVPTYCGNGPLWWTATPPAVNVPL
ncbi:sorbitol dehydrogenase family protein [Serratia grimesii]|uniref:sorbitol dehydrogenase family protein n=1 Tax=Serratia grimesii TaxID=82995 RepID=UPI00217B474A|nr:sorbitol dehydrogenase family protein [Serratia grimesii]CAI0916097.1 Membrane bound FAD containing D-sorbitol dehydrogenase [Serratia grimesii]